MDNIFYQCFSLVNVSQLDTAKIDDTYDIFKNCYSLVSINLKNANLSYELNHANLLSKESLLYLINNEASTRNITIRLAFYAYTRLVNDVDIVTALTNHPNITLASA